MGSFLELGGQSALPHLLTPGPSERLSQENSVRASERALRIQRLAAKPDDLSPIPGSHTVEGENCFPEVVL